MLHTEYYQQQQRLLLPSKLGNARAETQHKPPQKVKSKRKILYIKIEAPVKGTTYDKCQTR